MILRAVLDELRRRPSSTVVGAVGFAVAVALAVGSWYMANAYARETRVVQRDMGLNVRVIPAQADIAEYWRDGFARDAFFPESYTQQLRDQDVANRLIPMLRVPVVVRGVPAILTGLGSEIITEGGRKPAFGFEIEPGTVVLGGAVAESLRNRLARWESLDDGDEIEVLGTTMRIANTLRASGAEEDAWIYANLRDVQAIAGQGAVLNEIRALECRCEEEVEDPLGLLKSQLEPLMPGTRVVRLDSLADARGAQRRAAVRFAAFAIPTTTILGGVWVGVLAWINIRERTREIGVLRALGFGGRSIAMLVVGRSAAIALIGAALGGVGGLLIARVAAGSAFEVTGLRPLDALGIVTMVLVLAPVLAMFASAAAAAHASSLDPALALMER